MSGFNRGTKKLFSGFFRFIVLSLFLAFAVLPVLWIIITSLKTQSEVYTYPIIYIPSRITFGGYYKLFQFSNFGNNFINSILIAFFAALGGLCISVLGGFMLSRLRTKRNIRGLMLILYFTQMVPSFLLMVPLFFALSKLHLTNNRLVLVIVYIATTIAFGSVMSKGFFDRIPVAIEEAALIDGCDPFRALFKVILPISMPGLVAIFSFSFVNVWNELFLAVMLISNSSKQTMPVFLNSFMTKAGVSWDVMSAGIVLALLPTMVIFAFGQKYIVAGLTEGGVKG